MMRDESASTRFFFALLTTFLALLANCSVLIVSETLLDAGEIVVTMAVLALPPRDADNRRVNLLSRKFTCPPSRMSSPSLSLKMTLLRT